MLSKAIRILDFDGSITKQKTLLSRYESEIIGLEDIGPSARFWCGQKERDSIRSRIARSSRRAVTFLGSGDFHHITETLISGFDEPLSVIDFDFHPDWCIIPARQNCGSWVNDILKRENILKCILMGTSSADISSFALYTANFKSLENDRVEIYPYSHKPSIVYFRKVPDNISIEVERSLFRSRVSWNELKEKNLTEFFLHILKRLPGKKVYITIDKDCLNRNAALTNWEEGRFSLDDLLLMLKLIRDNADIAGADITGDWSDIVVKGTVKGMVSSLDHPGNFSARAVTEAEITRVNEDTNLKILEALLS